MKWRRCQENNNRKVFFWQTYDRNFSTASRNSVDELSLSKSSRLPFLSWKWNNSVSSSSSSSRNRLVSEVGMMMMRGTVLLMIEPRTPLTWLSWVAICEVSESPALLTLLLFKPTGREAALRELVTSVAGGLRRTDCPSTFSKQLEERAT